MRVKYPLLVTRCARCGRRRACALAFSLDQFPQWLCRQCLRSVMHGSVRASLTFRVQGR